ncbi:hypothetical protein ABZ719_36290 [Streptomyces sp. NPDC006743]|uniref:hypothetical protein n=1 Tax=Streptomyces sp. NPDC006743 TaxID=3154480 RepID=UPI0034543900
MVDVSSSELTAGQLLGAPEMAELGGINASTLRAYSRGDNEVPLPQATVGGRDQWARAVAEDWVEARRRSFEGIGAAMAAEDRDSLSPGAAEGRDRFATDFQRTLFDRPDVRKRWVLRQRNRESVAEVAGELAWTVAASLDRIIPTEHLGRVVRAAVMHDWQESLDIYAGAKGTHGEGAKQWHRHLNLTVPVAKMLDWYIRHFPANAYSSIGDIQREAHERWGMAKTDALRALRSALSLDGELTEQQRETYFALLEPHEDTD